MNENINTSDWFCIATEGKTIDGRKIERSWLEDIAQNYSPSTYQALIWCEHSNYREYDYNLGTVEAVKLEEENGKLKLFAQLKANRFLKELNELEQKIFTSIEIMPDFPAESQSYLVGLAVTDQPASTGLDRLKFSRKKDDSIMTAPVLFSKQKTEQKKSIFEKFFKGKKFSNEGNKSMTQDEINALVEQLQSAQAKIEELELKINELTKVAEASEDDAVQAKAEEVAEQVQEVTDAIDDAQDSAENLELSALRDQVKKLSKKIESLETKAVTQKPSLTPTGNQFSFH